MVHVRKRMLYVGACLAAAAALFLGLGLLYNLCIRLSLQRESKVRLRDPEIMRLLAPVAKGGDPQVPAVLFLHGFGGSPHDFRPLLDAMPEHLGVYAPVLPGHGLHSPLALQNVRFVQWQDSARVQALQLKEKYAGLIIVGFSLGGLLALDLAVELEVDAVIVINPFVGAPYRFWYLLRPEQWVRHLAEFIPYVKKVASGRIEDPAGVQRYEPGYYHLPMRAFQELHAYARKVRLHTAGIVMPLYWHLSARDIVSDPNGMVAFAGRVGTDDSRLTVWSNSNHVLLYDYDAPLAIPLILEQIQRHCE